MGVERERCGAGYSAVSGERRTLGMIDSICSEAGISYQKLLYPACPNVLSVKSTVPSGFFSPPEVSRSLILKRKLWLG